MRRSSRNDTEPLLPLIEASKLWHIGTLDHGRRGERGGSLEGNLFSVSACPCAWREIAQLGGAPLHESGESVLLLDMLCALQAPEFQPLRDLVTAYGLEEGLLQRSVVYKAICFDDELDGEVYSLHESQDQAEAESDEVEAIDMLLATAKLKKTHALPAGVTEGVEYAMIEWLRERVPALPEQGQTAIAGVYWDERYAPELYSAPRGGLFNPAFAALRETQAWPDDDARHTHIDCLPPVALDQLPTKRTLTLYHGTDAQFDDFSLEHSCTGAGTSVGCLGVWLAPSADDAAHFGSTILTVEADWRRPYTLSIDQMARLHKEAGAADSHERFFAEQRQRLLDLGHDSIAVLEFDGRARSVIALQPETLRIIDRGAPAFQGPER